MTLHGNLRRAGTVSASTVALLLGGGGLAFASVTSPTVPGTLGGATDTVTSTVSGTTSTVTGTVTGVTSSTAPVAGAVGGALGTLLPTPSPSQPPAPPAPVKTVLDTVTGLLQQSPAPLPTPVPGVSQPPSSTSADEPASAPMPTHSPRPTMKAAPTGPAAYEIPPEVYAQLRSWRAPQSFGELPTVAPAAGTAVLAAASAPQLATSADHKGSIGIPHPPISGVPGILVILATIAVGAVAAGHVGVLQQRLGRTPRVGRHAAV